MARALCLFEGQAAGYLTVEMLASEPAAYGFMPLRSPAHLSLVQAVARNGLAPITIEWDDRRIARVVTRLTTDSITLAAAKA